LGAIGTRGLAPLVGLGPALAAVVPAFFAAVVAAIVTTVGFAGARRGVGGLGGARGVWAIKVDHAASRAISGAIGGCAIAGAGIACGFARRFGAAGAGGLVFAVGLGGRDLDGLTLGAGLGFGFGGVALGLLVIG